MKKSKGRILLKIFGILVAVIIVFIAVTALISVIGNSANMKKVHSFEKVNYEERIIPEKDSHGNYCFTSDRELKIVQLTDIHIGGGWMSLKKDAQALNAVAAMLTAEKPDFVIVTGDITYPVPFQSGTFNNKSSARLFAELMEQLGVYWTAAFGNHDSEIYSYYSRESIAAFYEGYSYCILTDGPEDVDGVGNQIISIKKSDGTFTQLLCIFDSHTYTEDDSFGIHWRYDNIHDNQIQWYKQNIEMYEAGASSGVNSLAFFHIPLEEYRDAWYEYTYNGFEDTDNVTYVYGTAGCTGRVIYCSIHENSLFETMLELGSTKGIFCGHDHSNNFSLDYKGIRLTYGMSVDYLGIPGIWKRGAQRGCTVITVSPDGSFDCHSENYYQDKYKSLYEKEDITMQTVEPVTEFRQ